MLSFIQFISESQQNDFGWLRPKNKQPVLQSKHGGNSHKYLANKFGYITPGHAMEHAGWVRFIHQTNQDGKREASYQFHNTPTARKLIANHLGKSGGFQSVHFDVHPPKNPHELTSHSFQSVSDARNHLNEDFAPPKLKGWMSPSGLPHLFNADQEHAQNFHPSYRGIRGIHSAQKAGYVRFGSHPQQDGTTHHYIHYSELHPKGKLTALKTVDYLKPHHNDYVTLTGSKAWGGDSYEKKRGSEFAGSVSHARSHLREAEDNLLKPHHIKVNIRPHPKDPNFFKAYHKGKVAGAAIWMKHDINNEHHKPSIYKVAVNPEYRNKGVATQLYHHIEKHIGQPLHPSSVLSDDGFKFWSKFRPDAVKDDLRNHRDKLMGKEIIHPRYGKGIIHSVGIKNVSATMPNGNHFATTGPELFQHHLQEAQSHWRDWGIVKPSGDVVSGHRHPTARTHSHLSAILKTKHPEYLADFGNDTKTGQLTLRTYGKQSLNGALKAIEKAHVRSNTGQIEHYHSDENLGHDSEHVGDVANTFKHLQNLHRKLYPPAKSTGS